MHRSITVILTFAVSLAFATDAAGSGFLVARQGGEHGHPTTDHPSAMYYNPAGLALAGGSRIYLEGLFAYRAATYDRPVAAVDNVVDDGESGTPLSAVDANSGRATLGNALVSPFAAVTTNLGIPNLGVGVGVYVPFGGQATWDRNDAYAGDDRYAGAVDGVQRWSIIEGEARAMYITAAAAYRFEAANLSIGAGFNVVRQNVNTIRAKTTAGTDDLIAGNGATVEGRSWYEASGTSFSIGAGAIWQPRRDMWIGASYQSQPGFGDAELDGVLTNQFGATASTGTDVVMRRELPDVSRVGARYRPTSKLELRVSGELVRWSVYESDCGILTETAELECEVTDSGGATPDAGSITFNNNRRWDDAFGVRAGASYWVQPTLELVGGAGYDGNAVPDETMDAGLMDMEKVTGTIGARYALPAFGVTLSAYYLQIFYFERDVTERDRDADGDAITMVPPTRVPDGAGTYNQWVGALTLGAEYAF